MVTPPIEPNTPEWFQRYAKSLDTALNSPSLAPTRLYAQPTAKLPPPAKWVGCIMYDVTLSAVVVSDGSAWNAL